METVYIETTIPSYMAARPSSDALIAIHQALTHQWWQTEKTRFSLYSSVFVREEASRGDQEVAARRLTYLAGIPELASIDGAQPLAENLAKLLDLPAKAVMDASHLSLAILHQVDYLLTWNCTHLANPVLQRKLVKYCNHHQLHIPIICTPELLITSPP